MSIIVFPVMKHLFKKKRREDNLECYCRLGVDHKWGHFHMLTV